MTPLLQALIYWGICEIVLLVLFPLITIWLSSNNKDKISNEDDLVTIGNKNNSKKLKLISGTSWLKGFIERLFIIFLLLAGFEGAAIILFGAVKLGTRVDQDKGQKVSNDYFLIGNFLSIAGAIVGYLQLKDIFTICL